VFRYDDLRKLPDASTLEISLELGKLYVLDVPLTGAKLPLSSTFDP
jgi:hypothetical protein